MPQGNEAKEPQLTSMCSRASELQLLSLHAREPVFRDKGRHRNEQPKHPN